MASFKRFSEAPTIIEKLRNHVDFIREEYVDNDASLDQLVNTILVQLNIKLSKSTLEKALKQLGIHKYTKRENWRWVEHEFRKRKRDNKDSELLIHGELFDEEKRQKRIRDHVSLSTQHTILNHPTPPGPDGWIVQTPLQGINAEERTPSPPPGSPTCQAGFSAQEIGNNIDANPATLATAAASISYQISASSKSPLGLVARNNSLESIATGPEDLTEYIAAFENLILAPKFATWGSNTEYGNNKHNLETKSLALLIKQCELFDLFWRWTDADMMPEEIDTRYHNIAVLISTSIPWHPDDIEFEIDLALKFECVIAIEILYATYHGDAARLESAVSEIELTINGDVMKTALFIAVSQNNTTAIDFFLSSGICDINCQAADGTTCVHQAATTNQPEALKQLLTKSPDLEIKCRDGETAFFKICGSSEHDEVSQLLIEAGANMHTSNARGYSAICEAAASEDCDAIVTMINRGMNPARGPTICDWCPFHSDDAIGRGCVEMPV